MQMMIKNIRSPVSPAIDSLAKTPKSDAAPFVQQMVAGVTPTAANARFVKYPMARVFGV